MAGLPTILKVSALAGATVLASSTFGGCDRTDAQQAPHVPKPAVASTERDMVFQFNVGGLHCDGCAASVRNTISKIKGVRTCSVSFASGTAEVVLNPDSADVETEGDDLSVVVREIVEAVEDLGFTIDRKES